METVRMQTLDHLRNSTRVAMHLVEILKDGNWIDESAGNQLFDSLTDTLYHNEELLDGITNSIRNRIEGGRGIAASDN